MKKQGFELLAEAFSKAAEAMHAFSQDVPGVVEVNTDDLRTTIEPKADPECTLAELRQAFKDVRDAHSIGEVRGLLEQLGVKKLTDLSEDKWDEALAAAKARLK